MRYALAIALVVLPLVAAFYAQYRLASHTSSPTQLWLTRLLLIGVGLGLGWAMSRVYLDVEEGAAVLTFLSAFGIAHVPAAIILFLKKLRSQQIKSTGSDR